MLKPTPSAADITKEMKRLEGTTRKEAADRLWHIWRIDSLARLQTELTTIEGGGGNLQSLARTVRFLIAVLRAPDYRHDD